MTQPSVPSLTDSFELPVAWIEIERGRTRHPLRPMAGSRLMIGAGSHCDIQLGGEGIPILHSLIHCEGPELQIEALVATPPLLVRGRAVRDARLTDGDLIEIGKFHLRLRLSPPDDSTIDALSAPVDIESLLQQEAGHVAGLLLPESAAELVSALEVELRGSDRQAAGRAEGLAALVEAARAASGEKPADTEASLPNLVSRLERLADDLSIQCRRLAERERILTERTVSLATLQESLLQLVAQLESTGSADDAGEARLRLSA